MDTHGGKNETAPSADLEGVSWIVQRYAFDDQRNMKSPELLDGS